MKKYGIVQGRLAPQVGEFIQNFPDDWRSEFKVAKKLNVSHIEWIDGAPNGSYELEAIKQFPNDVTVSAICCDWLVMNKQPNAFSLHERIRLLAIVEDAIRLGVKKIVLPFLEGSSLRVHLNHVFTHLNDFADLFPTISFSLETDLDALQLKDLLERTSKNVKITFDTGNLTKLGFNLGEHLDAYIDRIDNVHIKDVDKDGKTTTLGTGIVDLSVLNRLVKQSPAEYLTFQTARAPGNVIETYEHNVRTIEKVLCM